MIPSTRAAIAKAVGGADSLPVMPAAIVRVLQALETDAGIGEIASLVARDVALATRVMRIANSTLYAHLGPPVATPVQAVSRLGLSELRNVALSMAVISALLPKRVSKRLDYADFWVHCATAGTALGTLVARVKGGAPSRGGDDPYFLAGLVHDIGIPLLWNSLGDRYDAVLAENDASDEPLYVTETRVLGFHHGEAGAYVLESWGLPLSAQLAARWHHTPLAAPEEVRQLAGWVHIADWMTHTLGHGAPVDGALASFDDETWDLLGVTFEMVREMAIDFADAAAKSREIVSAAL